MRLIEKMINNKCCGFHHPDNIKFAEPWIERKIRALVAAHKKKYPNFKYGDCYLKWVCGLEAKSQMFYAYHPEEISRWSKSRHKLKSLASLAKNENW